MARPRGTVVQLLVAAALAFAGFVAPAAASSTTKPRTPPLEAAAAESLQRKIDRTLEARRWEDALELIDRYLREVGRNPIILYNAACCRAQLGDRDAAANTLLDALKAGFREFDAMEEDPDLEPIRDHPTYTAILEARDRVRSGKTATADANPNSCPQVDEWKRRHGDKNYRFEYDATRRFWYATCLDEETHGEMKDLLEHEADHLASTLFGATPRYPTLIAVPTARDAKAYFADERTTGIYEHAQRQLVARDIGESLQHEFVHLMHYGHMERLRQKHPIWVQEGLASLYESYELRPDGSVTFLPNTRHNAARRAAIANTTMPWKQLFALPPDDFMQRSTLLYPQARSIFEYLAEKGKLKPFYDALCATYSDSPTGVTAMERAFGRPLAETERAWKDWLKTSPIVDDQIGSGDGSLGVQAVDSPDGARISSTVPRSAARAAGLRIGDVIVALDGKAIRSTRELLLAVAARGVGDTVSVRYRRGSEYFETAVTLRPLRAVLPR